MLVSMSKIKINFHLSLGYYILWNPSIGMAKRILAHNSKNQNFARYGIGGKISITILVFTLDYLQEKLLPKFFKRPKSPTLGPFWVFYTQIWGKNEFSWKKGLCQFLNIPPI